MTFRVALIDAEHTDRPTEYDLDELGTATDAAVARLRAGLVEAAIVRMGDAGATG